MAANTKIEWTDHSWNPLRAIASDGRKGWHCEHVSEGCRNCYAEPINRRLGTGLDYKPGHRGALFFDVGETIVAQPLRWKKPARIFVCSMTDLFGDFHEDYQIAQVFGTMAVAQQHIFQVLTKRPKRMRELLASEEFWAMVNTNAEHLAFEFSDPHARRRTDYRAIAVDGTPDEPLPNVWLGVSAEDQDTADQRIPLLLDTPAAIRFVSLEPLLGRIDIAKACPNCGSTSDSHHIACADPIRAHILGIDWVIAGGESGPNARPMHPDWARQIRDQCAAAGVSFFFKQWGEWGPDAGGHRCIFHDGRHAPNLEPEGSNGDGAARITRLGKTAAGRLLDGVEHNGFPGR